MVALNNVILASLVLLMVDSRTISEQVDMIELNHFHDCLGRHVYDQVIFYEWAPGVQRYHVRAWCLVKDREQNLMRVISSSNYRETWTQFDPERSNKKLLDESLRMQLVRRLPPNSAMHGELHEDWHSVLISDAEESTSVQP